MRIYRLLAVIVLLFAVGMPFAKPSVASESLKCPSCGMPMPTVKTTMMDVPIIVNGTKYYCCAGCPSGKKAEHYYKTHHGKVLSVKTGPKM